MEWVFTAGMSIWEKHSSLPKNLLSLQSHWANGQGNINRRVVERENMNVLGKKWEIIHLETGWRLNKVDLCCFAWYKMFYFTSKNREFTANDRSSSVMIPCTEDVILCRMLRCFVASGIIQLQSHCRSSKPTD